MFDLGTVFSSFVGALVLVVYALACMRIYRKLGYGPLLGLLMLVPVANFVVVLVYCSSGHGRLTAASCATLQDFFGGRLS